MANVLIPYGTNHEFDELCEPEYQSANIAAARIHYGLDDLVSAYYTVVRVAVAEEGYGLDVLSNDKSSDVREAVQKYLSDNGYKSLTDWKTKNPDMVYENDCKRIEALKAEKEAIGGRLRMEDFAETFDELARTSNNHNILLAMAASNWNHDAMMINPSPDARIMMAKYSKNISDENIDKLIKMDNKTINTLLVRNHQGLDKLINSKDASVRKEIADIGYGLDKLVTDAHADVRKAVAKQGYGLDVLMKDKDPNVRLEVARRGYGLDTLIDDADTNVRCAVARHGYGLDKLINDKEPYVRQATRQTILDASHLISSDIEYWIKKFPERCVLPENKVKDNIPDTVDEPEGNDGEDKQYE